MPWAAFVAACLAPLGGEPIRFSPVPRTAERGFMVSYRWAGPRLDAVTVYALPPSLPPDRDIPGAWKEGMDEGARVDYETALAGVRGFGPPSHRGWHTLLGWTLDRDGTWHRAAGLRIPPAIRAA
jgi:hypothetical protein